MNTKILIVEDHPAYANGLLNYLKNKFPNFEYHHVNNNKSAIKSIKQHLFEIIIIGINLPNTNSIDLIRELRKRQPNSKIVINGRDFLLYDLVLFQKLKADAILFKNEDLEIWDITINSISENRKFYSSQIREQVENLPSNIDSKTLTESELSVLKLICKGYNTDRIAEERGVSINTINTHKKNIFNKFDVHNAVELAVIAVGKKII